MSPRSEAWGLAEEGYHKCTRWLRSGGGNGWGRRRRRGRRRRLYLRSKTREVLAD